MKRLVVSAIIGTETDAVRKEDIIMKNENKSFEFVEYLGKNISKGGVYSAKALAHISATIFKKRLELGMNQKEFAAYMNVSQGMVSKWESADYNFTISTIADICEKLGLSMDVTFELEEDYIDFLKNQSRQNTWCKANGKQIDTLVPPSCPKRLVA